MSVSQVMRLVLEWPWNRALLLLVTKRRTWLTHWLDVRSLWNIDSRAWTYWNHTSLMLGDPDVCVSRWRLELTVCQSLSLNRRIALHLGSLVNNVDVSASLLLGSGDLLVLLINMMDLSWWQNLLNDVWSESNMFFDGLFLLDWLFFQLVQLLNCMRWLLLL